MLTLTTTRPETASIIHVSQIVDGYALCHCGTPARLLVTTEPDGEPGYTCGQHAFEWIDLCMSHARTLFLPDK